MEGYVKRVIRITVKRATNGKYAMKNSTRQSLYEEKVKLRPRAMYSVFGKNVL